MPELAPSLLLLIPAYNEELRIEPVLRDYAQHFQTYYPGRSKIVVVLNGCVDNTLSVVQKVAQEFPIVEVLNFPDAIGKGGALIEGLRLATDYDLAGYVDADGATSPQAFLELVKHFHDVDCVVASRWIKGATLHQAQSTNRQFASRVFHTIVELLFHMGIRDTQCGAKVVSRRAITAIYSSLRIADMAFDINLLYSLRRAGYKIREVPTVWTDKVGTKVALGRTSLTMLLSVIRLRLIYSPFYAWLIPFRPLEVWLYKRLRAPLPRSAPDR